MGEAMTDPNLELLLMRAKDTWEKMTPEEKREMLRAQRDGWVKAETQWAKDYAEGKCERD